MILKPLRISPSSFSTFFKCSMQYKWAVIDEKLPDEESDNIYAVLGTTLHKAMELFYTFNLSYDELKKSWKILFLNFMTEAKNLPKSTEYESFVSKGYDLLRNAFELKERWKDWSIVSPELYYRLPYPNKFIENTHISGRIDLIARKLKQIAAIDWKTSNKLIKNVDEDPQMSFYIYCLHLMYKIDYDDIFGVFVHPSLNQIIFTQRSEFDIKRTLERIDLMLKRISLNDFKKEPKINNCLNDCTFCPYTRTCDGIQRTI